MEDKEAGTRQAAERDNALLETKCEGKDEATQLPADKIRETDARIGD